MLQRIVCLAIGYLFGCFLTANVVAKNLTGTSIFELGDGNPGMANVGHELGSKAAAACLAGDILKTVFAAILAHAFFPHLGALSIAYAGLGSTLGHIFPFWHNFKGGKGITTIFTTMIMSSPVWGIAAGLVGIATIILSGYLCVAAVVSTSFFLLMMLVTKQFELAFFALAFLLLTLFCHGPKLRGIKDGSTHRASMSTKFWAKLRGNR